MPKGTPKKKKPLIKPVPTIAEQEKKPVIKEQDDSTPPPKIGLPKKVEKTPTEYYTEMLADMKKILRNITRDTVQIVTLQSANRDFRKTNIGMDVRMFRTMVQENHEKFIDINFILNNIIESINKELDKNSND